MFKILSLFVLSCFSLVASEPGALVTITPYRYIIDRISGGTVKTTVLVPPGANLHTYEPTPKQVMGMNDVGVMFTIGEPVEKRALPSLKSHNKSLKIINLQDGIDLICGTGGCSHCKDGCDLHFWLSPRLMQHQAKRIEAELSLLYPAHKALFEENLQKLEADLDQLDHEITVILTSAQNRHFFVSHPAFGYFARDYGLTQHSIEFEGKDPTPKQLTRILDEAKKLGIKTIFTQSQFSSKGAHLVASEIGANIVELNPYPEDYLQGMRETANKLAGH